MDSSLVWQLIFETLRWKPNHDRLTRLAARQPDINAFQSLCSAHGLLPVVDKALGPVRQTLFTAEEADAWRLAVAAHIIGSMVMHRELERLLQLFAAAQLQGLKAFDIHDDFHPFIMNAFWSVVQTHLMLET